MDLTDNQLTLWKEYGSQLAAPAQLRKQALSFYSHYRTQQSWLPEKTGLVLRVAYFLSQKTQLLFDSTGQQIKGVALSANAILKDHPRHEQFLYHLKQMLRSVPLPPHAKDLEEEINAFSKQLSFAFAFLGKVRSTLTKIRVSQKTQPSPQYNEQLQKMLWLLFIDCRRQLRCGLDIVQGTCLLGCVIVYYIYHKYRQDGIFSIYLEQGGGTLGLQQQELTSAIQFYLHIKDVATYKEVQTHFNKYMEGIKKYCDLTRPFSLLVLGKNVVMLQKLYNKKLSDDQIDQSIFVKNGGNKTNNPPQRVTPFGRRALFGQRVLPALSHRILNYEQEELQQNKSSVENVQNFSIIGKLKGQPTPKGQLIRSTPMSEAMQMYNWIYQKSNQKIISKQDMSIVKNILVCCSKNDTEHEPQLSHIQLAGGLWIWAMSKCELADDFADGLLLLAVHLTLHVLNAAQHQLQYAMNSLDVKGKEAWKALDALINMDKTMPLSLRLHLLSLQTSFVNNYLWRDIQMAEKLAEGTTGSEPRLFKRVLHGSAYEIYYTSTNLQLQQEVQDCAFLILQHSLRSQNLLIYERSLSQLILCSLYAAVRVKDFSIKFSQIMHGYQKVLGLSSVYYQQLIEQVKLKDCKGSIIQFYNHMFVPALRQLLVLIKNGSETKIHSEGLLLSSRVRELVARQVGSIASPQLASYYAYNESPILRPRLRDITNSTIRKQQVQYTLQDIQAKFGKTTGTLRSTRKIKH